MTKKKSNKKFTNKKFIKKSTTVFSMMWYSCPYCHTIHEHDEDDFSFEWGEAYDRLFSEDLKLSEDEIPCKECGKIMILEAPSIV